MNADIKRGQNAAVAGLVLQLLLAAVFCVVWLLTGTVAAKGVFVLNAAGLVVWIITTALFYCRRMAELEAQELADLAESRGGLFEGEGGPVPLAQRRLTMIRRWVSPLVTLLLGLALLIVGLWLGRPLLSSLPETPAVSGALEWAFFCLGASFFGFLVSRYALGMAKTARWRLLRAGGGFMTLGILTGALLCATFFLDHLNIQWGLQSLPYINAALMLVLGAELLANFVLDFYRPRKPDVEPRPGFDSRLANLLGEPGGVAHSIAEAINYQFGFEVSSTWFYQLLRKTLVPLILFGLAALIAISAVVIVDPGQQGVVLTFGAAGGGCPTLDQGIHVKWPWPIQTADIIDTGRIRSFTVGIADDDGDEHAEDDGHGRRKPPVEKAPAKPRAELIIWTREHEGFDEIDFLTALRRSEDAEQASTGEPAGAFGLARIVFQVDYRVTDAYRFRYGVTDVDRILRGLAMREVTRYAAQRDMDTLMQRGGGKTAVELQEAIDNQANQLDLGVAIVAVTVRGVHPQPDVAKAFEEIITAEQEAKGSILAARITADGLLSTVAGSRVAADALVDALVKARQLAEEGATTEQVAAAEKAAAELLDRIGGKAKVIINQARAERWATENAERGRYAAYPAELSAFAAAPRLYALNAKLNVLSECLLNAQKMILGVDPKSVELRYQDDRRVVGGGFTLGSED